MDKELNFDNKIVILATLFNSIKYFFIIITLIVQINSFGQKKLDSLWAVYNNKNQSDTNRLGAIDALTWGYTYNNPDSSIILANEELKLAQRTRQKKI